VAAMVDQTPSATFFGEAVKEGEFSDVGLFDRQAGLFPGGEALGLVAHVGVTHLLQRLHSDRASEVSVGVNDDGGRFLRDCVGYAQLEPAARD
jgi:hypothetical protein